MARLLVIGNGLAGTAAALCAKRNGHEVTVVTKSYGRTALSSGALFLAAPHRPGEKPPALARAVARTGEFEPHHPFAMLSDPLSDLLHGYETLAGALDSFWPKRLSADDLPFRVAADNGTFPLLYGRPSSMGLKDELTEKGQLVAPLQLPSFFAKALQGEKNSAPSILPVDCAFVGRPYVEKPAHLARLLDEDANLEALADALRHAPGYRSDAALFFPPILGLHRTDRAFRLSENLQQPVYELAGSLDSVFGLRLQRALEHALSLKDIPLRRGAVSMIHTRGETIKSVAIHGPDGQSLVPVDALILASGKFLGGGVLVADRRFKETLLNLPLFVHERPVRDLYPGRLTHKDFRQSQLFSRLGLRVDASCRPRNEKDDVVYTNLFACGHLLGGFDAFTGCDADGVDLATAACAARLGTTSGTSGKQGSDRGGRA